MIFYNNKKRFTRTFRRIERPLVYRISRKRLEIVKQLVRQERLSPKVAETYGNESAKIFLNFMKVSNEIPSLNIALLAETGFHKDPEISKTALNPLLGVIINELKKDFKQKELKIYLKMMPALILRAKENSELIRKWFKLMQINESNPKKDLYERSRTLINFKKKIPKEKRDDIKKIFVLSRSTMGAEIALNGIIIPKLLRIFKNAEIIFIDSTSTGKYLFKDPKIKIVDKFKDENGNVINLKWDRKGMPIKERFECSANVSFFINHEIKNLREDEYFIVDADTRLSQTGSMPLVKTENHYFIDTTQKNGEFGVHINDVSKVKLLGRVCNEYLNYVFEDNEIDYPQISLSKQGKLNADSVFEEFGFNNKFNILFRLGVGVERRQLSREFEIGLANKIIKQGHNLILIRSPDADEEEKNMNFINALKNSGKSVTEIIVEDNKIKVVGKKDADFYTFRGDLESLKGMIKNSSVFLGYNSNGQHIASALEVPFVTISTGHANRLFYKRWIPLAKTDYEVIEVNKKKDLYDKNLLFRGLVDRETMDKVMRVLGRLKNKSKEDLDK